MSKLKAASFQNSQKGFTLIELMVVVTIMVLLATYFTIGLGAQKIKRNLQIAQNELVTNIRKTQSYVLSSRLLTNGQSAQYYLLKFDLSNPTQYKIVALYNTTASPMLTTVETINLPANIQIATTSTANLAINITRSINPTLQPIYTNCALLAFAAPFAKVIFNDGCSPVNPMDPYNVVLADDYYSKIIFFQNNINCITNPPPSPAPCSASTDSVMTITLTDSGKTMFKTVTVNGVTGAVNAQ